MTVALIGLMYLAGFLAGAFNPRQALSGYLALRRSALTLASMYLGALLMIGIQLWIALASGTSSCRSLSA